jgi:hypothetical protein
MMRLKALEGKAGHHLITDEEIENCSTCKKTIDKSNFYFCNTYDRVYCEDCTKNGKGWHSHTGFEEHTHWHIIKIEKETPNDMIEFIAGEPIEEKEEEENEFYG